jgi:hypothetical protein
MSENDGEKMEKKSPNKTAPKEETLYFPHV